MNSWSRGLIELDGRMGEGGGQLVRIAVGLSALTGVPIRIHHVRGNRGGGRRGGGLKAQHASCVNWLAEATKAQVRGCHVGSQEFEFRPSIPPSRLLSRDIRIGADSAASILLVFQAIFPFLLFASDESSSPITVSIRGGTNVSFSLSYDYLDQVLLPTLEQLGVPHVECQLQERGWSHGSRQIGSATFTFTPLPRGQQLDTSSWPHLVEPGLVQHIDVTIIAPQGLHGPLRHALTADLARAFPLVPIAFRAPDDSRHPARIYALLVGHTAGGRRLGRDCLYDRSIRGRSPDALAADVAQRVIRDLQGEVRRGGGVDEFLQDQLVVFQALAGGPSCVVAEALAGGEPPRLDRADAPFGVGSLHTKTARWVVGQLLPGVKWRDNGRVCEGVGWKCNAAPASLEDNLANLSLGSGVYGR